jgi:thymidylate kinase
VKVNVEDGLYQARAGELNKLDVEDDGLKKIRVTPEVFEAVREVQKRMRKLLGGRKPDIGLVAEALLLHAARSEGIEEKVREYCASVFSGR